MSHRRSARPVALAAALATLSLAAFIGIADAASPVPAPVVTTFSPCRLLDTRAASVVGPRAAPLTSGETLTVQVTGTNGNCTVPSAALGVVANVTVVDGTAASFLTVFPSDQPQPTASNMNWAAGQAATPNQVTAALSATGQLSLFNLAGSVNVIVDLVGYLSDHNHDDEYVTRMFAKVRANGSLLNGAHVVDTRPLTGSTYRVQFDRDVSRCAYSVLVESPALGLAVVAPPSIVPDPNSVVLLTGDLTGAAKLPFHLVVTC